MLSRHDGVVLDTLLPSKAHPTLGRGICETDFRTFYTAFASQATSPLHLGFRVALWAATWLSPLLIWRLPPLARHDRTTRERALNAMATSRVHLLRQLLNVLKTVTALCYGADPHVRDVLGYHAAAKARER